MGTLVVKNLPDDLHERLHEQARRHHRSITKEVTELIETGVAEPPHKHDLPPSIKLRGGPLTIEEIEAAIAEGQK